MYELVVYHGSARTAETFRNLVPALRALEVTMYQLLFVISREHTLELGDNSWAIIGQGFYFSGHITKKG